MPIPRYEFGTCITHHIPDKYVTKLAQGPCAASAAAFPSSLPGIYKPALARTRRSGDVALEFIDKATGRSETAALPRR
jgi:hypothetical protein